MSKVELPCIYKITNNLNHKFYIGSTVNLRSRLADHLINKTGSNIHLQRAIEKYGIINFKFEILEFIDTSLSETIMELKQLILNREQYWINLKPLSYNILPTAGNNLGFKHSEETKTKISKSRLGKKSSNFEKLNNGKTISCYNYLGEKIKTFNSAVLASINYTNNKSQSVNISRCASNGGFSKSLSFYWRYDEIDFISVPIIKVTNLDDQTIGIYENIIQCSKELRKLGYKIDRNTLSIYLKQNYNFPIKGLFINKTRS